ncbi:hypothetical protein [Streptomyces antimicrobicus]|uniref:Transposase n=1 Tax=Streptomyces antimicrobicus TaxID=2883108 RepID=A0ABS8BDG0_9ACTN|nr:hypothetical protein [Streptomyces antimicrobicus]MCB5182672.1 hypothetical protein [Streptomyces antimicrobicus]
MQIARGRRVALNGVEWTVEDIQGQRGRLILVDGDGRAETRSFRWLINHADLRLLPTVEASRRPPTFARQPRTLADLTEDQLEGARVRAAHVLEAETGFREGHQARALHKVLRKHHVKIHPRRGVNILGLWYHHPVLDEPCFQQPSARGGKHAGQWVIRRDRHQVFFQDPADHEHGTSCAGKDCLPKARSPPSRTRPPTPS